MDGKKKKRNKNAIIYCTKLNIIAIKLLYSHYVIIHYYNIIHKLYVFIKILMSKDHSYSNSSKAKVSYV